MVFIRNSFKNTLLLSLFIVFISCGNKSKVISQINPSVVEKQTDIKKKKVNKIKTTELLLVGANQTSLYLPILKNKNVAIVGNQTSVIFKNPYYSLNNKDTTNSFRKIRYTHLVDSLLSLHVNIKKVFAPEHGFRGESDAAEWIDDGKDIKTGLPIISLYSKNKKPSASALSGIDIVIFDIQDVGVRFYTYISTLHYMMQACAENKIPLLVLDRPNPNGHYIDGPTLEKKHSSFVGVHPIPVVHGMTIGEYAKMVNGEGWLGNELKCDLEIITVKNYTHNTPYSLFIRPSPNLPNDKAINLYPSLGFFEGTSINAGRGTEMQFQVFGSPDLPKDRYNFNYTPQPNFGSKHPKHQGLVCNAKDLRQTNRLSTLNLEWLIEAYQSTKNKETFFNSESFTIHAGTKKLQLQIEQGYTYREIRKTWLSDLEKFKKIRSRYLLYK